MYQELKEVWAELTSPGAPFEVAEVEVRGATIKTYKNAPPSLREVWLSSAAFADRDYLVYEDDRWTYGQAHDQVGSIGAWLASQGVHYGDRVAIAMRNYPEWMLTYWACVAQGIEVVGMNAWWVTDEMEYGLTDSRPKVLVCDQERLDRFHELDDEFSNIKVVGVRLNNPYDYVVPFEDLASFDGDLPEVTVNPDDNACIFYTSGTTGHPKGAELTHRGCVANIMNIGFAGNASSLAMSRATDTELPNPEDAPPISALVTTPLFHVTANNCLAHATTVGGGKLVHMYRWDATRALELIEREKITNVTGVPVMARELISHPDFDKYDTSSMVALGGGGAQLQPDLVGKIDKSVKTARPNTGYGMTETCGIITSISADFFVDRPESCGPAMPTFDVKVVDSDGNELPSGEVGELWVKGAPVIKGYLNRSDATAESIVDGWLRTGDVARLDGEGFIYIVDRIKDMVIRGGENIYCAEVETGIFHMDGVAECTVFGVPDDRLGEEVGAAVVPEKGATVTGDAIREYCAKHMAKHKIPRYIWLMDSPLPRNANGKFLKRELKESLSIDAAV
jgi:long-chain acyl-CoA synthetase